MLATLKEMLKSKKALMMLVSIVVWAVAKLGIKGLSEAEVLPVMQALWIYVGAQGVADLGKGAALVKK